jgi:hypothetical protein
VWCLPFLTVLLWPGKAGPGIARTPSFNGPDATLGPYGSYRDWPPKTGGDKVDQGVPGAPARETVDDDGQHADPVTGEALAFLQHEGSPQNQIGCSNTEV